MFGSLQKVQGKIEVTKSTGDSSDGKSHKMFFKPLEQFIIVDSITEAEIGKLVDMHDNIYCNLPKWICKDKPTEGTVAEVILHKGTIKVDKNTNSPMNESYPNSFWWNFRQKTDYRSMTDVVATPENESQKTDATVNTADVVQDLGFDPTIKDLTDPKIIDRIVESLNPFSTSYSKQLSILWQVANYHAIESNIDIHTDEGKEWAIQQLKVLCGSTFIELKEKLEESE